LRHGDGRFADRNNMNVVDSRECLVVHDETVVSPIESVPHRARRLDRFNGSEEELPNPSACQLEVVITDSY
jgi:hypothetical protein